MVFSQAKCKEQQLNQQYHQFFPITVISKSSLCKQRLLASKQGHIIRKQTFDLEEWGKWNCFILEEIQLQVKMNKIAPNSFLEIFNWSIVKEGSNYDIYVIYESKTESCSLPDFIKKNQDMDQDMIFSAICSILQIGCELENCEIYHMNIKPNNLIWMNGRVKLTDFGSARIFHKYFFNANVDLQKKKAYHFYQCQSILEIAKSENKEIQNKKLYEINQDEEQKTVIFRQNDDWALGIIVCQLILKDFGQEIKQIDDFYAFNSFRIDELLKKIYSISPQQSKTCKNLIQQKMGSKKTLMNLVNSYSQQNKTLIKAPFLLQFYPLGPIANPETKQKVELIKNYYYASFDQLEAIQNHFSLQQTIQKDGQYNALTSSDSNKFNDDDFDQKTLINSIAYYKPTLPEQHSSNIIDETDKVIENQYQLDHNRQQHEISINKNNRRENSLPSLTGNEITIRLFETLFRCDLTQIKNTLLQQFYSFLKVNDYHFDKSIKHSSLLTFSSEISIYQNSICSYSGYQLQQQPHGLGIQIRKKNQEKVIFGMFDKGNLVRAVMLEECSPNVIQCYCGDFDEKEMKDGICNISWHSHDQLEGFKLLQNHRGQIKQGIIEGYGERIYYSRKQTSYKYDLLYKGQFQQSKKHGRGILYKLNSNSELEMLYNGEFENDRYCGTALAFYEKDLIVEGKFKKGKLVKSESKSYKGVLIN